MPGRMTEGGRGRHRNPIPTVDIIIEYGGGVVLIERRNPPLGWALPGGFIDYGESAEDAAVREALEETSLRLEGLRQFHLYSDPGRDCRMHTLAIVFVARGVGEPRAADDARALRIFRPEEIPAELAFDHRSILEDYLSDRWSTR